MKEQIGEFDRNFIFRTAVREIVNRQIFAGYVDCVTLLQMLDEGNNEEQEKKESIRRELVNYLDWIDPLKEALLKSADFWQFYGEHINEILAQELDIEKAA
ncbi:hypothetical protein GYA49_04900 [Candidatus Beckwithbacteria bacterium]|nr:hypothetical protein [Candidatus Beckwithbacteria bacterium]